MYANADILGRAWLVRTYIIPAAGPGVGHGQRENGPVEGKVHLSFESSWAARNVLFDNFIAVSRGWIYGLLMECRWEVVIFLLLYNIFIKTYNMMYAIVLSTCGDEFYEYGWIF